MVFPFTDKNGEALENYTELWDEVKDQIKAKSGDDPIEYEKDFIKARFESNDDLPLRKMLNIPVCIIIVKSVFQRDNSYYPQVLLYECLLYECYELYECYCMNMKSKNLLNQILIKLNQSWYTRCVKFYFCSENFFSYEISILIICIHFTYKWE